MTDTILVSTPNVFGNDLAAVTTPFDVGGNFGPGNLTSGSVHETARTVDTSPSQSVISIDMGPRYEEMPVRHVALANTNLSSRATWRVVSVLDATPPALVKRQPAALVQISGTVTGSGADIANSPDSPPDGNQATIATASIAEVWFGGTGGNPPTYQQSNLLRVRIRCAAGTSGGRVQLLATNTTSVPDVKDALDVEDDQWAERSVVFDQPNTPLGDQVRLRIENLGAVALEVDAVQWDWWPLPTGTYEDSGWQTALVPIAGPGGISADFMPNQLAKTAVADMGSHVLHRYWTVYIRDANNLAGYLEFGQLWGGPSETGAKLVGDVGISARAFGGEMQRAKDGAPWIDPPKVIGREARLELLATKDVGAGSLFGGAILTGSLFSPFLLAIHAERLGECKAIGGFLAVVPPEDRPDLALRAKSAAEQRTGLTINVMEVI